MQRLPDSLDSSKEQVLSDDEEKLNMFMSCDINLLFDSTKNSFAPSSLISSKNRPGRNS